MERLTVRINDEDFIGLCRGQVCAPNPCYQIQTDTMTGNCADCPTWAKIIDTLAAYEDTNLTPAEIETIKSNKYLEKAILELERLAAENERLKSDYEKTRNHATNLTLQLEAWKRATKDFESATGIFSFACFCCAYKNRDNVHKCDLLGDEVCEDMENWKFDLKKWRGVEEDK